MTVLPLAPFLAGLQLTDSAFPSGRYTLSYGLESFVQEGLVGRRADPSALATLLSEQVEHGVAPADGVALAWAHRAVRRTPEQALDLALATDADRRLTAVKLAREAREASVRTGRGLLGTASAAFAGPAVTAYAREVREGRAPGNGAVVMGVLMAAEGVPLAYAVAAELYAFAAGWLQAAVRLGVADHRVAQVVLHRTHPVLRAAAEGACATALEDLASSVPLVDLMTMRHEQATLRLFMS